MMQWFHRWSNTIGGQPARVLIVGLDSAGKTTILYKLKLNEVVKTIPTIGFNVETVTIGNDVTITVLDMGGSDAQKNSSKLNEHVSKEVEVSLEKYSVNKEQNLTLSRPLVRIRTSFVPISFYKLLNDPADRMVQKTLE